MAYYYMDTDGGSDANAGTSWAAAKLTLEGLLAVMAAGDVGYVQGLAKDTAAASRTFTSPGTVKNPVRIIGVADGTTNTGTSVVAGDLASTLPVIEVTGAGNDVSFSGGSCQFANIKFICPDRFQISTADQVVGFSDCEVETGGWINIPSVQAQFNFTDTKITFTSSSAVLNNSVDASTIEIRGGSVVFTSSAYLVRTNSTGRIRLYGVDLSTGTTGLTGITSGTPSGSQTHLANCKMPASYSLYGAQADSPPSSLTLVGCSDDTSVANTSSIQDYQFEDVHGTIDLEATVVRTDGADDGASGAFAYSMTPHADSTLEGTDCALRSPWLATWVAAGSATATVYICNDTASTDYNENEVWCEFFHPDNSDTAQHDHTFDAGDARKLDGSTAVTDDTGSTWGTGGNNHQKFSASINPGFEGWVYARVYLAKRQATPDTLYLDPKIEVV